MQCQIASQVLRFFITSLRPCHLCCRVSLKSWQFDISPQALRSSFCFNLVVFRLVRPRIVPSSVPCCPSYFCFGLRCAWLNRFWLCIKRSTVTCCCLPTRFADQSSRVCPCSSFRPQCRCFLNMTLQVFAVMLCWMVLALACPEIVPFALPCCLSYICFGARFVWSNRLFQRCQCFSCAN